MIGSARHPDLSSWHIYDRIIDGGLDLIHLIPYFLEHEYRNVGEKGYRALAPLHIDRSDTGNFFR